MKCFGLTLILLMVFAACGCSNGGAPALPDSMEPIAAQGDNHVCLGYFQFIADPAAGTLECIPLRDVAMHLNALRFLEPPPFLYLSLEYVQFNGNIIDVDIGLRHPFLGLDQFTGFDVSGIFITNGSVTGFDDPDIRMAGPGDTRLLNPDGFTRWWNPDEFPVNNGTIFGYTDGLLGAPDSSADYNSTLNAYKYYCDDIGADTPSNDVILGNRGMFSAGQKNIRHYTIEIGGDGLVFNYAIDANWKFPVGDPPYDVPDCFAPAANRPEAWAVSVTEMDNSLYYEESTGIGGGELSLAFNLYDWFNADLNDVYIESLSGIPQKFAGSPTGGGGNYSTYQIDINGLDLTQNGEIEILITAESEVVDYGGLLPGKPVSAYFTVAVTVDDEGVSIPTGDAFYTSGDKTPFAWGILLADNEQWVRNFYMKATGTAAENSIVKFYQGHGSLEFPYVNTEYIYTMIETDGFVPVQSSEEPIDPTGCRTIMIVMPGRYAPDLFSVDEAESLKQFIRDGGILVIAAEVYIAFPDTTTFDDLIQKLGGGASWGGDYEKEGGGAFDTDKFDHGHLIFDGCEAVNLGVVSYLDTSKPTDNIILWGVDGEAIFVECQIED